MSAPICPVNGRACPAACAGAPSCERAGAVVGRVRRAAVRKQAEDAVMAAAQDLVTAEADARTDVKAAYVALKAAVDALNALEAQE